MKFERVKFSAGHEGGLRFVAAALAAATRDKLQTKVYVTLPPTMRQPFTQLYVHFVWATFDRAHWINAELEPPIYACILHKVGELQCFPLAIGGDLDHVHLLIRMRPSLSVAQLIGEAKGASAHLVNHNYCGAQKFVWQGAYGAFSVSPSGIAKVTDYIRRQKEHHANRNLQNEWEETWLPDDWIWREDL